MLKKMLLKHRQYPEVLVAFSGLLAGLTFSSNNLPVYIVPFALILFIQGFTQNYQGLLTDKSKILVCFYFFITFHGAVLSWFLDSNISGLIGASSKMSSFAAIFSWAVMSIVLTLPMLLVVFGFKYIQRKHLSLKSIVVFSALWVVCEWLRSLVFSIFLMGPGGSIGDYWNFGSLGLAAIDTPLAPLSRLLGLYGLTFLVTFISLVTYKLLREYKKRGAIILILMVLILVLLRHVSLMNDSKLSPIINGSVLQNEHAVPDFSLNTPIESFSNEPKDIIVLPEYSYAFTADHSDFAARFVNNRLAKDGVSIDVDSGNLDERYGTLVFRNTRGEITGQQTKKLLIPTGEYLPYVVLVFYKITGQQSIIDEFNQNRAVQKGEDVRIHTSDKGTAIGPIACSGILDRNAHRQLARGGATIFTNSASLIDFGYSQSYFNESLQMAKFHAIANHRPLAQATLGAPAFVIDGDGAFVVPPSSNATKMIDFTVQPKKSKTFYTLAGEWALYLSITIVTLFLVLSKYNPRFST